MWERGVKRQSRLRGWQDGLGGERAAKEVEEEVEVEEEEEEEGGKTPTASPGPPALQGEEPQTDS